MRQHYYNHNYYVNIVKLWETLFNGFENCWYNFRWRQRKQSFHLYNVFPWLINGLKDGKYKFFPPNTLFLKRPCHSNWVTIKFYIFSAPSFMLLLKMGHYILFSCYSLGNKNGNFHLNFCSNMMNMFQKTDDQDYLN